MHDPMTVAYEIRSPRPRTDAWTTEDAARTGTHWKAGGAFWVLAGRGFYFPALVTIWHRDPSGYDHTTCRTKHWRLHIHHWRIQVRPLQELRRRLLTRCSWCHGRHTKTDQVNISHQWDRPRGHWWQGENGLFHKDCSLIKSAHSTCVCHRPALDQGTYGRCAHCGKHRAYGTTPDRVARSRTLAAIPAGHRHAPRPTTDAPEER
ncbi:hypothetical protein [Streptomyces graminilatus]|uniref:hypothetical protein n=1 Tax=Streptomyces graminilatus TaxID=1464070 RepID=UPI0006E3B4E2|nr:hypothetical protein [Streptomyces graminilatus]